MSNKMLFCLLIYIIYDKLYVVKIRLIERLIA